MSYQNQAVKTLNLLCKIRVRPIKTECGVSFILLALNIWAKWETIKEMALELFSILMAANIMVIGWIIKWTDLEHSATQMEKLPMKANGEWTTFMARAKSTMTKSYSSKVHTITKTAKISTNSGKTIKDSSLMINAKAEVFSDSPTSSISTGDSKTTNCMDCANSTGSTVK